MFQPSLLQIQHNITEGIEHTSVENKYSVKNLIFLRTKNMVKNKSLDLKF